MKKATLKALNSSIRKWENIRDETGSDQGTVNCALCKRFYNKYGLCKINGEECPIHEKTGKCFCQGSPIEDWANEHGTGKTASTPVLKEIAQKEIDFLTSLLPSEATS